MGSLDVNEGVKESKNQSPLVRRGLAIDGRLVGKAGPAISFLCAAFAEKLFLVSENEAKALCGCFANDSDSEVSGA